MLGSVHRAFDTSCEALAWHAFAVEHQDKMVVAHAQILGGAVHRPTLSQDSDAEFNSARRQRRLLRRRIGCDRDRVGDVCEERPLLPGICLLYTSDAAD